MIHESISAAGRGPRVAHSYVIRGETPPEGQHTWNDVSPQVRRCWIAMQEDDRIPFADVHVCHGRVPHRDSLSKGECLCRNRWFVILCGCFCSHDRPRLESRCVVCQTTPPDCCDFAKGAIVAEGML